MAVLDREGDRSAGQYHVQISNQPYVCHYQTGVSGFSTTWSVDCFQEQKAALETAAAPETPTPQPAEQQATEHAEPANKSGHQRAKSDSKGSEQASPVEEKAPVAKDQHAAAKTSAQQTAE